LGHEHRLRGPIAPSDRREIAGPIRVCPELCPRMATRSRSGPSRQSRTNSMRRVRAALAHSLSTVCSVLRERGLVPARTACCALGRRPRGRVGQPAHIRRPSSVVRSDSEARSLPPPRLPLARLDRAETHTTRVEPLEKDRPIVKPHRTLPHDRDGLRRRRTRRDGRGMPSERYASRRPLPRVRQTDEAR